VTQVRSGELIDFSAPRCFCLAQKEAPRRSC